MLLYNKQTCFESDQANFKLWAVEQHAGSQNVSVTEGPGDCTV